MEDPTSWPRTLPGTTRTDAHHELVGVITNQEIDHQMLLVWLGTNEAG